MRDPREVLVSFANHNNRTIDDQLGTFIAENVTFFEWRTQKKLDGMFNNLESNPQIIDLKGSKVTLLPDTYKGRRLGHNWSISFVADELQQKKLK